MARHVDKRPERNTDGQEDLAILHPDRQVVIDGVEITVREIRFKESLRYRHCINPIVDGLYQAFQLREKLDVNQVLDVLAQNADEIETLVCVCCDIDKGYFLSLDPHVGEDLVVTWWIVNKDFFVTSVNRRIAREEAEKARSDGPTSTTHSENTVTSNGSGNTPNGS